MKIQKLILENFRNYQHLELDFDSDLTVIVGDNGIGKTSILDAVVVCFGRMLSRLPGIKGVGVSKNDIRMVGVGKVAPAYKCYLKADFSAELNSSELSPNVNFQNIKDNGSIVEWAVSAYRDSTLSTRKQAWENSLPVFSNSSIKRLNELADALVVSENGGHRYVMPLMVYYGTDRAVFNTPMRRRNFRKIFPRFDGLNGALNPGANFKRVFEWYHQRENIEIREQKKLRDFSFEDQQLKAVRRAIAGVFPDFSNPRTELGPLRFVVDKKVEGIGVVDFDLNQLSDGYRTTLALVVDLACRMVESNPPEETGLDPLKAEAVVLIDEVDLHLHPEWQQRILGQLKSVFENTQFIVTTHSPQVLSTVPHGCIRKLVKVGDNVFVENVDFSLGAESNVLLKEVQGVDPRPGNLDIVMKLNEYLGLIAANNWDTPRAIYLREILDDWGKDREPILLRADMDIRLRERRR